VAEYALAQVAEGAREQPGHVHLGDAQLFPDLSLGHVAVEAHHQQPLFPYGEIAPVRPDGLNVEGVLEMGVVLAEDVGQVPRLRPGRSGSVQRGRLERQVGTLRVAQLVVADAEVLGQFVVLGRPGELLRQLGAGPAQLQPQFLGGPLDVHVPPLVTEVPLDLAGDARLRIRREVAAEGRVEIVDGLEQADVTDLHQLLGRLGAVPVALGAGPDQRLVPADKRLAG